MRIHQARVAPQRLAITFFRLGIILHQPVHISHFVIVERQIRLNRRVLPELFESRLVFLLFQMRESEIEMHKRKLRIGRGGGLKFRQGQVVLLEIQMIFPDKEMVLRRALAEFDQLRRGAVVQIFFPCPMGRIRKHIQVRKLPRFLRPERLQRGGCIGPALGKKVA